MRRENTSHEVILFSVTVEAWAYKAGRDEKTITTR